MQAAIRTINTIGIQEIESFLAFHHKKGHHFSQEQLRAWAADAEFQMDEGNTPTIEIPAWDSQSGHTETFTISDAGVDTQMVEIEE
jgi:hypothetical protein